VEYGDVVWGYTCNDKDENGNWKRVKIAKREQK